MSGRPAYLLTPFQTSTSGLIRGLFGRSGVERGLVGVVQHVHDVRAADARRIVEAGILEAARLQVGDALVGVRLHVVLGAEQIAWVGQALAQAGPWPTATRSEHSVHL